MKHFEFHSELFDAVLFVNPYQEKPSGSDEQVLHYAIAYEMEYRNIRHIDAHHHGILTLFLYRVNSGVSEPLYGSKDFSYKRLASLPKGAWVLDMINEENNRLVFRSWVMPNKKIKDSAESLREMSVRLMACFPGK